MRWGQQLHTGVDCGRLARTGDAGLGLPAYGSGADCRTAVVSVAFTHLANGRILSIGSKETLYYFSFRLFRII